MGPFVAETEAMSASDRLLRTHDLIRSNTAWIETRSARLRLARERLVDAKRRVRAEPDASALPDM